jgi:segregation and condensation protein B
MLKDKVESLLFISMKPLTAANIFSFLKKAEPELKTADVQESLATLTTEYNNGSRGINIIEVDGQYQMVTSTTNTDLIKKFLKDERSGELTQPSLETLTIIAYRGPVTKPVLEQIRGVNCSLIIRNLLIRDLITYEERDNDTRYSVTPEFLKFLGLTRVTELPDYDKLHTVENLEQFLQNRAQEAAQ